MAMLCLVVGLALSSATALRSLRRNRPVPAQSSETYRSVETSETTKDDGVAAARESAIALLSAAPAAGWWMAVLFH